ncbi:MAG: serine/threonine-protein kinase [Planctomycetes bacterium]|nr:serine/threonine-protein kinase [Planctomycetota bacterium]
MVDRSHSAQDSFDADDPVGSLLAECLELAPEQVLAAVETACREHPELADELRRRFGALRQVGLLATPAETSRPEFPERLGEFRLLERLGGGGMGVVYRAVQESLGRVVALKLIRPEQLYFPKARERFHREAEAAARLQHPGIVPVHTVGETQGIPYIVMEFVPGATLAELLDELDGRAPESLTGRDFAAALARRGGVEVANDAFTGSWVQHAVEFAAQVADALQHAHERGVLHRDVKPSNIVLSREGRARLLDFGLAVTQDAAKRVTASGAALGTLLYMSPEQVRGDLAAIDVRSDVYSLGATLYELLTLQTPYSETTTDATRLAILDGRPDSIRARNRSVPRDLEIVCAKALEKVPARRYADAASFARDLRNVLAHRPIEARAPNAPTRLARWARRHPARALSVGLAFALVAVTPSVLYFVSRAHARELERALEEAGAARAVAQRSETEAQAQKRVAETAARDAGEVAEFLIELFGASDPSISRGSDLRARELLDDGAARLDTELVDQPEVRRRLLLRIGVSYAGLGEHTQAVELLRRALAESERLHGPDSPEVAEASHRLAWSLLALGSPEARALMERALAMRRALHEATSDEEVRCLVGCAAVATANGRIDDALPVYHEALEALERAADARGLRAMVLANRAHTLYAGKRFELAIDDARDALTLQREVHGASYPGALASLNTLALALKHLGRKDEAEVVFTELLDLGERVHGAESSTVAIFASNRAGLIEDLGRRDEARAAYEGAWKLFVASSPPTFPQRVTCGMNLALLCMRTGSWSRSEELYAELAPSILAAEGDASTRYATALNNVALCREARGAIDDAVGALEHALEFTRAQTDASAALRAARIGANLARVLVRARRHADAERELVWVREYLARNPNRVTIAALADFAEALRAEAVGDAAAARVGFESLERADKLDEDTRWLPAAARARLAVLHGDVALGVRAAAELEASLGATHVETLAALEGLVRVAEAAGDAGRADQSRAELERRRAAR